MTEPTEGAIDVGAIQKYKEPGGDLLHLEPRAITQKLDAIEAFQQIVQKQLRKDHDYGIIPGTQKPTLLKPGAEKIAKLLNLADTYEIVEKIEDWDKPFFSYTVRCTLTELASGTVVCSYLANCNSYENKYRWRWVPEWKLTEDQKAEVAEDLVPCESRRTQRGSANFYRFPNDAIYDQVNTLMKMAEKRAMISAVLSVGRLSLLFTVDLDDYVPKEEDGGAAGGQGAATNGHDDVKGPGAANVRPSAPNPPTPSKDPKGPIVDGRYTDDKYPVDMDLTLPDGTKVSVSKFKALELFEKMKKAIGEERYYAVLGSMGYENKADIPVAEVHLVYAMLAGEWKKLRKAPK